MREREHGLGGGRFGRAVTWVMGHFRNLVFRSDDRPRDSATIAKAIELLAADSTAAGAGRWKALHQALSKSYLQFSTQMGRNLEEDQLLHLLGLLLVSVGQNGFRTEQSKSRLFDIAQAMGIHVIPVHFYSPIPDTSLLPSDLSDRQISSAGRLIEVESQLDFLRSLRAAADELSDIPESRRDDAEFYWKNPAFGPMDGVAYYSLIRTLHPGRVIEVGSGYSTLLAARAARLNGDTRLTCIEPYPLPMLAGMPGIDSLVVQPVQSVPLTEFESLRRGDVLFVDSTHVSKTGSDVNYLVLEVLPRLVAGVMVHFHDIFLPYEYPRHWIVERNIFWNEQYLLLAFLLNGTTRVRAMHHYLGRHHATELREIFPLCPALGGGSMWLETL